MMNWRLLHLFPSISAAGFSPALPATLSRRSIISTAPGRGIPRRAASDFRQRPSSSAAPLRPPSAGLLTIGAVIVRNTRRVRPLLASHHPLRAVFIHTARALPP
jgi:hypothetical protein